MWTYFLVFAMLGATIGGLTRVSSQKFLTTEHSQSRAVAGSMAVYRNYVIAYARSNPSVTGTAPDSALALPAWYTKQVAISNYVENGKGFVYIPTTIADVTYLLVKQLDGTINVGIKQGGYLINPLSSTNTSILIAVPGSIPEGAIVIAE